MGTGMNMDIAHIGIIAGIGIANVSIGNIGIDRGGEGSVGASVGCDGRGVYRR